MGGDPHASVVEGVLIRVFILHWIGGWLQRIREQCIIGARII